MTVMGQYDHLEPEDVVERARSHDLGVDDLMRLPKELLARALLAADAEMQRVVASRERVLSAVDPWGTDYIRWYGLEEPVGSEWVRFEHVDEVIEAARAFEEAHHGMRNVTVLERRQSAGIGHVLDVLDREHGASDFDMENSGYGGYRKMGWEKHPHAEYEPEPPSREALGWHYVEGARAEATDTGLKGLPASPGTGTGRGVWLDNPRDGVVALDQVGAFPEGAILLARHTDPDMLPAMHRASGIVTCVGGMSSHAAHVARELRVPCVVGVELTPDELKTWEHARIRVNGDDGTVERLAEVD